VWCTCSTKFQTNPKILCNTPILSLSLSTDTGHVLSLSLSTDTGHVSAENTDLFYVVVVIITYTVTEYYFNFIKTKKEHRNGKRL